MTMDALKSLSAYEIESLCAAAMAAPSADNRHVFRMAVDKNQLWLMAAPELLQSPAHRRVLGFISLGAVQINLTLRAAALGLHLEADWAPDRDAPALLARFVVQRTSYFNPDALESAIEQRQTNRAMHFKGPKLPDTVLSRLAVDAQMDAGVKLVWLDETDARRQALRLLRIAESARFNNRYLHQEMFDAIRFDLDWKTASDRGIPPGALALPAVERIGFPPLRAWWLQCALNLLGTHRMIGFRAADLPCRLAPHLGVITATGSPDQAALGVGRALQRVWLQATNLGLAFQVFAAAPLYSQDGFAEVPSGLRNTLKAGWTKLFNNGEETPYIMFRMGRTHTRPIRAGRPAPLDLLLPGTPQSSQAS